MKCFTLGLAVAACVFAPAVARADNTSCAGAIVLVPDGSTYSSTFTPGESRWFRFSAKPGRSYSITAQNDSPTDLQPGVYVGGFHADCAATPLGTDSIATYSVEPVAWDSGVGATRASLMFPATSGETNVFVAVNGTAGGKYSIYVQETTLFSNWFFVGGDYMAFTLLRNTTNSAVSYTIHWRDSFGAINGTESGVLTANGSVFKNAADVVPGTITGSVDVAHTGTSDAIVASTTILSATTGLSFDAPFIRRGRR